jgi:hypothetical protein
MIVVDLALYCTVYHKFISLDDDCSVVECRLIHLGFKWGFYER